MIRNRDNRDPNIWIDAVAPSREELSALEHDYRINPEHLQDIMDADEQSRIEREDEYTLLIVRLPAIDLDSEVPYYTIPCGIILFPDRVLTICQTDNEVLDELRRGKEKGFTPANQGAFVLHLLGRAAIVYLRYLKEINRRNAVIESDLQVSVKNNELTQLLSMEKSLVFFTTSLKSNEILLEKFQTSKAIRFGEDASELIEDVVTDNKEAIEMANIYSDILSGMMDAFASVISNNLNIQMKRLTIFSIVLMIPTFIVSVFGMNVKIPFMESQYAFVLILIICVLSGLIGAHFLKDKPARPRTRPKIQA